MEKDIPILAETATAVLDAALKYPTAGYSLVFNVIGEGEYRVNGEGFLDKIRWVGNIPLNDGKGDYAWLTNQIAKGFVAISVQSPGRRPHYYKELHRARGIAIPI